MNKTISFGLLVCMGLGVSCREDMPTPGNPYVKCNELLSACAGNGDGAFCTFGYKWGESNPFYDNAGLDIDGPGDWGGQISYSLAPEGTSFNTHSQTNVTSVSLKEITVCTAEHEIKRALEAWASVADLEFVEVTDQRGDIQFIVADIEQGGIGYPNYTDDLCSTLAGQLIIDVPTRNTCDGFYNLVLHEIGHTLGLGHVSTANIMNPGFSSTELQPGDIQGIQSIYGAR